MPLVIQLLPSQGSFQIKVKFINDKHKYILSDSTIFDEKKALVAWVYSQDEGIVRRDNVGE